MSLDTSYRSPTHKLLKWFKESRDNWKTKYQELKKNFKQLENRIRFLESSKNFSKEILFREKLILVETINQKVRERINILIMPGQVENQA